MNPLILLGDLAPADIDHLAIERDAVVPDALVLANLETPICGAELPRRPKAGPALRAETRALRPIVDAFPTLAVNLANNHTMDYGVAGLRQTIAACAQHGILTFGAGESASTAHAPLCLQRGSTEIVLIGACERQFGLATASTGGVAALSPLLHHTLQQMCRPARRIVVSVHAASEMSPWPAPRWQQTLRALIDAGADLVHGHHAHVPQGFERYGKGWIVYGAGNTFVNPSFWPEGGATLTSWRYQFDLDDFTTPPRISQWKLSAPAPRHVLLASIPVDSPRLRACNSPLDDPLLLEGLWQENALHLWKVFYAAELQPERRFMNSIMTCARHLRAILQPARHKTRARGRIRDRQLLLYHFFACEHHAEAIATALALEAGEIPDRRNAATRSLASAWLPGWKEAAP